MGWGKKAEGGPHTPEGMAFGPLGCGFTPLVHLEGHPLVEAWDGLCLLSHWSANWHSQALGLWHLEAFGGDGLSLKSHLEAFLFWTATPRMPLPAGGPQKVSLPGSSSKLRFLTNFLYFHQLKHFPSDYHCPGWPVPVAAWKSPRPLTCPLGVEEHPIVESWKHPHHPHFFYLTGCAVLPKRTHLSCSAT